ncbi:MAG: pantetheine-phosphate adenylyltransferase [Clostridiales bacterium]|jgi:pantetheine-phosphate adenylyltransferase|nr:pantetheine-phosphate adenylyltransferase [Clostridiales bacterium]
MKQCIFAGTFDPISLGHVDIARRAARAFDNVIVAVCDNAEKRTAFTLKERLEMAELALKGERGISAESFSGLLTDFCKAKGARYLVRGLRNTTDFEYEKVLFEVYKTQLPDIECVYFTARGDQEHIQSSYIRELLKLGGDCSKFIPSAVLEYITKINKI